MTSSNRGFLFILAFIAFVTAAVVFAPRAHSETPTCSSLSSVVNEQTIEAVKNAGNRYVLLLGDNAQSFSDKVQDVNNEPHMSVDRVDIAVGNVMSSVIVSKEGCIQDGYGIGTDFVNKNIGEGI